MQNKTITPPQKKAKFTKTKREHPQSVLIPQFLQGFVAIHFL